MYRISVGQAVGAGFRLIGREPVAFAAWCAVCFVIYGVPQMLMFSNMGPMLQALAASGGDATNAKVLEAEAAMMRYQPLSYLAYLALILILPGAVFRAVLRPEERSVLFLKVGAAELWTLLVTLVVTIGWIVALFAVAIPIVVVVAVAAVASGGNEMAAAGALAVIPAMLITLWPLLRLSMAPVMAFADRTFRLPESWRLTKGHAGRMFLVGVTLTAIIVVVELVLLGVGVGLIAGSGAFNAQDPMRALAQLGWPMLLAGVVVWSVLMAFIYTLWMAAWADMYRQLRPQVAETFA